MANTTPRARLLVTCADTSGIVATVTTFLFNQGVNVTHLDQHTTRAHGGVFFMRVEFTAIAGLNRKTFQAAFAEVVARRYGMDWRFAWDDQVKRAAFFVSKHDHALMELLWRARRGELPCEVAMVIGNHAESAGAAKDFGVPFHHVPYDGDIAVAGSASASPQSATTRAEERILELTAGLDLLVLARFMRILSPRVVDAFPARIINIHHSFLPAFAGARPYHQAWDRGVKVIGATAHYVTAELDQGPIIEQDTLRVSHRHGADELVELGRDVERQVLARAVKWHLEDRVIVHEGKTVVFT
jgi:formyltetrahydrofolate deformylase